MSGSSRRRFLAGGLFAIGGTSMLFEESTTARFSDSVTTSGTITAGEFPSLDYVLIDRSSNSNAQYEIAYEVENVTPFGRLDLRIENVSAGHIDPVTRSLTDTEGTIDYPEGGGQDGGAEGDTYEFEFLVYEDGASDPVIEATASDVADGDDSGDGDFGDEDSPRLDWLLVDDDSTPGTSTVEYDVYYAVDNLAEFGEVEIDVRSSAGDWASGTLTNTNTPIGKVTHGVGNTDDTYDIVANVKNENGITVDSTTITDVADGIDPSPFGEPTLSDSPEVESFTVSDNTDNSGAKFEVDYSIANADRLGGVLVHFDNRDNDWADATSENGPGDSPTVSYSRNGAGGSPYHITVEALETRDGVTFPVDSGTVEDVAGGSDSPTEYPADSI